MRRARPSPAPVPRRIPPLAWRRPAWIWTPAALALAIGWPPVLLSDDPGLARVALIVGAVAFAASLISLGAVWLLGRPPRTRRTVIVHILLAGAASALAAPFVLENLLGALADAENPAPALRASLPYALAPLALLLGLPIALFSAIAFALVALVRPPRAAEAAPAPADPNDLMRPDPSRDAPPFG